MKLLDKSIIAFKKSITDINILKNNKYIIYFTHELISLKFQDKILTKCIECKMMKIQSS